MRSKLDNSLSAYLRGIKAASGGVITEIFIMDNQCANVAMTDKTGDYWQGDEAKFQKSFANGKGAIFVDEVEFDKDFGTDLLQISVPVMYKGEAIGAITFGVFANKVK